MVGSLRYLSNSRPNIALTSCEAEYIAGTFDTCQAMWLDSVMKELNSEAVKPPRN